MAHQVRPARGTSSESKTQEVCGRGVGISAWRDGAAASATPAGSALRRGGARVRGVMNGWIAGAPCLTKLLPCGDHMGWERAADHLPVL